MVLGSPEAIPEPVFHVSRLHRACSHRGGWNSATDWSDASDAITRTVVL